MRVWPHPPPGAGEATETRQEGPFWQQPGRQWVTMKAWEREPHEGPAGLWPGHEE